MENEEVESVNNLEVADQEEVVESTTNTEANSTIEQVEEVEQIKQDDIQTEDTDVEKEVQSKEENAKYATARRKAEEEAQKKIEQARKEAYEQGLQQGKVQTYIGKKNPYTNQIINDEYDVQEYLEMYELDTSGKDPISGYRELQKDKARKEAEEKIKADERAKQEVWFENDTKDFIDKYSAEKLQELSKDADFNLFAEGKIGKVSLSLIYESYQKLISKYEQKSVETAKQIVANNTTTPGGVEEVETPELDWNNMSSEQFEKMIEKAKNGELR